jgi:DNA-binding CsgD family transcriptional regulator
MGRGKKVTGVRWDRQPFGKKSDREIAKRLGLNHETVRRKRIELGIPAYSGGTSPVRQSSRLKNTANISSKRRSKIDHIDWDAQPLGDKADRQIAIALGISPGTVRRARVGRGIPPSPRYIKHRQKGIDWDAQPLGEMPDPELAGKLNVSPNTVRAARESRGIPNAAPRKNVRWDGEPLGKVPDALLALMLDVSVGSVTQARIKRGIPRFTSSRGKWIDD